MLVLLPAFAALFLNDVIAAQRKAPSFRVIALAEHGGIHKPFVDAAKIWLGKLASENNCAVDYIEDTEKIDDPFLAKYDLFIQLNYPPYNWTDTAKAAFIKYIEQGKGGWIGFHHATLLGEFDGFQMWPWFHQFMGRNSIQELHRYVCYWRGYDRGQETPGDEGYHFAVRDQRRRVVHLRHLTAAERPRAGKRGRENLYTRHRS